MAAAETRGPLVSRVAAQAQWPQAVREAVTAMGWDTLCASDNVEADRAHFMRFYDRAVERAKESRLRAHTPALGPQMQQMLAGIGRLPQ